MAATALAGCGDDSEDTDLGGSALTKEPVKIGIVYTAGTPILNETAIPAALKAAIRAANSRDGFGGHPIELVACNDAADANKSAACARTMQEEGVVATISNLSGGNPDTVATLLDKAGIPQVGLLATSDLQFTCGTCFPMGAGSSMGYTAGAITALKDDGATSVYLVGVAIPGLSEVAEDYARKAAEAQGLEVAGFTAVDPTTADFAPTAAKITDSGADAVYSFVLSGQTVSLSQALTQTGFEGDITVPPGMASTDLAKLQTNGSIVSWNSTPPVTATSLSSMGEFTTDLKAEEDTGNKDAAVANMDTFAPAAWMEVRMLEELTQDLDDVTAASVLAALQARTTPLDMGDFGPGWTPGAPTDLPDPLTRIGDVTSGWPLTVTDGAYQLAGTEQTDVRPVLEAMLG